MKKKMCLFGIFIVLMSSIALAADLSEYPGFFVSDNQLNLYIVVGKSAAGEDVVGAIDIAVSLMQSSNVSYSSIAKLDEEILDEVYSHNLILVGGPCANSATAKIMDYPADCNEGFEFGKAKIKLYDHGEHFALVVAGRTALDTRRATNVLADYTNPNYEFTGNEITVEGIDETMTGIIINSD